MFDYKMHFDKYCRDNAAELVLSFDMPEGYEFANGTFDAELKTVFINATELNGAPDYEKAFYLFHELRHALQHLHPERFSGVMRRSIQYVIAFDGTCYKLVDGKYLECRLEGSEDYFTELYLGQPHEVDANTFAYEQVKHLYGDSEELRKLYERWLPKQQASDELYYSLFATIDERLSGE